MLALEKRFFEAVKKLLSGRRHKKVSPVDLYLDLMKRCVSNTIYEDGGYRDSNSQPTDFDPISRSEGKDWPTLAHTMIGLRRLDNLQACIEDVLAHDVPGDFIETGVWRGGATIFMRAALKAYNVTDRIVWVADSFSGLPPPDPRRYPQDEGDLHHTIPQLCVTLERVKKNFSQYGLLDQQVRFLEGWFKDTLPSAPMDKLSVMRLDGDMYESTIDVLISLYPKLSPGGYIIIDDYGAIPACRSAVEDFRNSQGITDKIHTIDWTGVYWRRR